MYIYIISIICFDGICPSEAFYKIIQSNRKKILFGAGAIIVPLISFFILRHDISRGLENAFKGTNFFEGMDVFKNISFKNENFDKEKKLNLNENIEEEKKLNEKEDFLYDKQPQFETNDYSEFDKTEFNIVYDENNKNNDEIAKEISKKFYNENFLTLLDVCFKEKKINQIEYSNAFNGALTFILPIMCLDFRKIKNNDIWPKSGNVINFYNEFIESSSYFKDNKDLFIKFGFMVNRIHFETGNVDQVKGTDLNKYFAENLFYDAYNILVKSFLISKKENKVVDFFKKAFDYDKCFPYQRRHLLDYLEILQKRAISWIRTFLDDLSFDDVLVSNFLIQYDPNDENKNEIDSILDKLCQDMVEEIKNFNENNSEVYHIENYNENAIYKTLKFKKLLFYKKKFKEKNITNIIVLKSKSIEEQFIDFLEDEKIKEKLKNFFKRILIKVGYILDDQRLD